MTIGQTINIHPYSSYYQSGLHTAKVIHIGRKWITLETIIGQIKVTRFTIMEGGLWKN